MQATIFRGTIISVFATNFHLQTYHSTSSWKVASISPLITSTSLNHSLLVEAWLSKVLAVSSSLSSIGGMISFLLSLPESESLPELLLLSLFSLELL